ncbi:peptidoglycan-binding protein [Streptomyces sp. JJ36]|uniref:N-acetylmuramoyl-L-alanine amidase n=1 Tax=Streptomyces sp. JJ36 TaxID=2736645 RepID=UPI001F35E384|nr:peptidoglycan-binding protein [Streptomyces sp. JJ36]MCF6524462.1 amidase [Streptomyces sp. JJ36]
MSRGTPLWRRLRSVALGGLAAALVLTGQSAQAAPAPAEPPTMNHAFTEAAEEYRVPRDLLVAVGYGETHLDGHDGRPSHANGYGVMHLADNPGQHSLERAAELTGTPRSVLRRDTVANIRGGAAVLADHARALGLTGAERRDPDAWYPAVARYGGAEDPRTARLYADTVYRFLADGVSAHTPAGERVTVRPRPVDPERGRYAAVPSLDGSGDGAALQSADYPPARWVPADPSNYSSGRASSITTVVVHVTQGSYAGTISWFQNPSSDVSAHYVVRSSDGEVTQMVRDRDTAWHARSGNPYSVGIEHEGYVDDPTWFTDAMYRSSAALTRHLCDEYGIPKDRAHVVGHHEVPGNDHTDPGPYWDWDYYMELVGGSGEVTPRLSFPSYDTLREGDRNDQVKAAQYLLNAQGFDAGSVDGIFGPATDAAVRSFQSDRGLTADGVVGKRTWTALLSAGSTPLLQNGDSGAAVTRLQRALTAALGRTVETDGLFGPKTEEAVRDYQTGRGLGVDGLVGDETWGALQSGR